MELNNLTHKLLYNYVKHEETIDVSETYPLSWDASTLGVSEDERLTLNVDQHGWYASNPIELTEGDVIEVINSGDYNVYVFFVADEYRAGAEVQRVGAGQFVAPETGQYIIAYGAESGQPTADFNGIEVKNVKYEHREWYTHDEVVIQEPIGFDSLQVSMKRNDYHGMSVEYSDSTLEFADRVSMGVLESAYNANLDTKVVYEVTNIKNEVVYSGGVDLSTFSKKEGQYKSLSFKVAEIDARTTFNSRVETKINVDGSSTIDGEPKDYRPLWRNIGIPSRHLKYINSSNQNKDMTVTKDDDDIPLEIANDGWEWKYIGFKFNKTTSEFGSFGSGFKAFSAFANGVPLFVTDEDFNEKFGTGTRAKIEMYVPLNLFIAQPAWLDGRLHYKAMLLRLNEGSGRVLASSNEQILYSDSPRAYHGDIYGYLLNLSIPKTTIEEACDGYAIYMVIQIHNTRPASASFSTIYELDMKKGSYIKMSMFDNLEREITDTRMASVHDVLNSISDTISENAIQVLSDWYGSELSSRNAPAAGVIGGGAYKMLTNGYLIRGLSGYNIETGMARTMDMSFKDAIESLDAIDCIGWGFSEEDGKTFVRVERWDWFYKNTISLVLTNVAEVKTSIDTDRIITELNIGYKKYATNDEYNAIDSLHGERTFSSKIKAVSNALDKLSEFIADNYAIEETRRAREDVEETQEFKYDEDIFILELQKNGDDPYVIQTSAYNVDGLERPTEFINCKITPRRNAERWREFLFSTNSQDGMRFISGTIYYGASYKTNVGTGEYKGVLDPFNGVKTSESSSISHTHAKFDAEIIEFEYPLTSQQYNSVKANPYGLVSVNGVQGWIIECTYKVCKGMANFKLLKKHI